MWVPPLGQEDPLEYEMATHSSILAWKIPQTEKPGNTKQYYCLWGTVQFMGYSTVHGVSKSQTQLSD